MESEPEIIRYVVDFDGSLFGYRSDQNHSILHSAKSKNEFNIAIGIYFVE